MKRPRKDKLKSALVATAGGFIPTSKSPEDALGELFHEVQKQQVYGDGKTFVDLIPRRRMKQIQKEYELAKQDPAFNLQEFVSRHFYKYGAYNDTYQTDPSMTVEQHITELWRVLERKNRLNRGSLVALPNPYVVPGGRFSEQFYWDSYFIMVGLAAEGRWEMIEGMIKNYAHMIRKFGFIPTANRTYFLSRSQPPFFAHMVNLLAKHKGKHVLVEYLPYLVLEHRFWMKGRHALKKREHKAYARVVQMPNGVTLNRYYDNKKTPRPESHFEDTETADTAPDREADRLYLHLRAGAESGWDFSSRWFMDVNDIRTIHTADIIPVDLNCLLYELEETIAQSYDILRQPILARKFRAAADLRKKTTLEYCWDEDAQFFDDFNFHHNERMHRPTLAAVFPLYSNIATQEQADAVAKRIKKDFLKPGGLVTTLNTTGQQWDSPNGWAPLQWVAICGLRNYGHHELADEIKNRWLDMTTNLFKETGKLVEKYDVVNPGQGGGGEYPLQDGFGWTNGTISALLHEDRRD